MIELRISENVELTKKIKFIEDDLSLKLKKKIFTYFDIKRGEPDWNKLQNNKIINIGMMDYQEIKNILNELSQKSNFVYVLWLSVNIVSTMESQIFSKYYDDLWYPAADDIIVVPIDYKWIIEIDHEEIIKYGEV